MASMSGCSACARRDARCSGLHRAVTLPALGGRRCVIAIVQMGKVGCQGLSRFPQVLFQGRSVILLS